MNTVLFVNTTIGFSGLIFSNDSPRCIAVMLHTRMANFVMISRWQFIAPVWLLHKVFYVQVVFGYYFPDNVGGATIETNFNYKYSGTICVQYLRILLSSFGKENFKSLVNRNQIFAFFHIQSSAEMPVVSGVSI